MSMRHILIPLLALAVLLIVLDTCHHTTYDREVTVVVFEDLNGDGRRDRDEPAIPDTLVVAVYNVHGSFTHHGMLTDAEGKATVHAVYTHFFNLNVVPPCGYRATTETVFKPQNQRDIEVGFAADAPRTGSATVRLALWDDQDGDGVRDDGELPPNPMTLYVSVADGNAHSIDQSTLEITTDAEGLAELDLGNSCSTLWVNFPAEWVVTGIEGDDDWFAVPYDLGVTEVPLGMGAP
ncbi:MAG: hypothetical protein JXD18_00880 [Anaerolineae bacterium]|nr:hypothetical protein [Anaerolineae bacterium]